MKHVQLKRLGVQQWVVLASVGLGACSGAGGDPTPLSSEFLTTEGFTEEGAGDSEIDLGEVQTRATRIYTEGGMAGLSQWAKQDPSVQTLLGELDRRGLRSWVDSPESTGWAQALASAHAPGSPQLEGTSQGGDDDSPLATHLPLAMALAVVAAETEAP